MKPFIDLSFFINLITFLITFFRDQEPHSGHYETNNALFVNVIRS